MPPGRGGRGRAGRGGRGRKDPKKLADKAALEEKLKAEREECFHEEERLRLEIDFLQSMERKELKVQKRDLTVELLQNKYKEIDKMKEKISEIQQTTGRQILKLEDELSRVTMLKEVVQHEKTGVEAELAKLKSDDGGKRVIAQLQSKIKQMEAEKVQKNAELQEIESSLNRKLAKQVSENRLMRITMKEQEADAAHRITELEQRVVDGLNRLISASSQAQQTLYKTSMKDTSLPDMENDVSKALQEVHQFDAIVQKARRDYLQALRRSKESVVGMTDSLADIKSMHSNIPQRIRTKLREQSHEELLIILDVLSFEDSVQQYLEGRWPLPLPDDPQPQLLANSNSGGGAARPGAGYGENMPGGGVADAVTTPPSHQGAGLPPIRGSERDISTPEMVSRFPESGGSRKSSAASGTARSAIEALSRGSSGSRPRTPNAEDILNGGGGFNFGSPGPGLGVGSESGDMFDYQQ